MQAVGRLGSYISQGVYTVSGPFHPFGGAVDIVVVEQPDGTLRSSPWFVRFGKFQGVLKSREKVVQISVNGVDAGFQMYLDSKGEAFFLREIDAEPVSGDDDADVDDQSLDLNSSKSSSFDSENGKIVAVGRSNSRRSRVLGLVFGRGSLKGGAEDADGNRERAEIAANLLEIKWSTNLGQDQGSSSTSSSSGATHDPSGKDNVQVACVELEEVSGHDGGGGGVSSESSKVSMVCSTEEGHEVLYLADGETGQIHVHDQLLHVATALLSEGTETEEVTEIAADLGVPVMEVSEFHSQSRRTDCSDSEVSMYDVADFEDQTTSSKPHLGHCSSEKVESICVSTKTSSYSSQDDLGLCENNMKDKGVSSTLSIPPGSLGDFLPSKAASRRSPSPSLEEENFFFSDLDESGTNDRFERSLSPEYIDKEDNLSHENDTEKLRVISSPIVIPRNEDAGEEVGLGQRTESLPNISSGSNSMGQHVRYPLSQSLDSTFPGKDDLKCLKSDEVKVNRLSHEGAGVKDYHNSGELKSTVVKLPPGDPSTNNPSPGGNWRIWPFSLRRSGSRDAMPPTPNDVKNTTSENKMPPTPNDAKNTTSENKICADVNKNELKPNLIKKKVRETTPTSEQIASLNLKEGRNIVTFTFSTSVLGKQEVDAQIYLWKWNSRIVISDVDGTITRSDVLGQFMPLVGVDWSQTGVAHLFSAIKENGYQLLFLSARSISQAYITRQFLLNLKQDGKVLPEGPVVISPDGLFPSLYREVIRRVPHEFKIACLEGIKALFPSDCNPFYAGFGNRETDEISYLKVGIPKGKIFIINPRGEIVVNRSLDTKSYTSMHALVNGMFPPTNSSEQEDFNQWNFWKLPPPAMDF